MPPTPPIPPAKCIQRLTLASIGMCIMAAMAFALACASAALLTWIGHRWNVTPLNNATWRELGYYSVLPSTAAAYLLLRMAVTIATSRRRRAAPH